MRGILRSTLLACAALLLVGILDPDTTAVQRAPAQSAQDPQPPARPRAMVDLPPERDSGRTIRVPSGGNLQDALDKATPGDRITLDAGARYEGPFRLRRKEATGSAADTRWIVVSSAADARLPRRGTRVGPSHAALMPKLVASSGSVIEAMPGAHHYRFVGVEISPADDTFLTTLVQLGDAEKTADAQPHHIVIERSYIHGDPKKGSRRGIALNSRSTAVIDSYVSDFKEVGADSQAVSGWNGAGPFRIANNYLEAAGENIMFGGADPSVPDLVPADIEIVRNHMAKPLRWKIGHPTFEGSAWAVKNLLELKNARRVLIEGNVLEHNWVHAQNGFAILFTPRNQDGGSPWSVVEDVTFVNNVVRHVGGGINVLGKDDNHPSEQTQRIAIRNNVFLDVGGQWGDGRLFQLLDGTSQIAIENNTALHTGTILFGGDHAPHTGFVFQNNITPHNEYGIIGSSTEPGTQTLARYFPRAVVRDNVFIGGEAGEYPTDNIFVGSVDEAGVGELRKGLRATAQGRFTGTDGRAAGADITALLKAVQGVAPAQAADTASTTGERPSPPIPWDGAVPAAAAVFWLCFGLLFYVYLGYPLVAGVRARLRARAPALGAIEPTVSIVVVAYNEGERIEGRLENLLALDYPPHRLEILVGSDGSTDDTVERARRYADAGVAVKALPRRRGKPSVLNTLVPFCRGEVVVFADARQQFDRGTLRALVANLADPQVGAVSGELMLRTPERSATAGQGAAFYWRYEKFIRSAESRVDSTIGATGAIYALRRELFQPIPEDTLLDDVLIPLRIVQRGYRVVFEPRAKAFDCTPPTAQHELARKARTIAGNFQLFSRERWLFDPRQNRLWFETMSHKALRLLLPVLHFGMLAANIALAGTWLFQWLLAGQMAFYAGAVAGCVLRRAGRRAVVLTVPYTVCLLSWATVVGFLRFVTDSQPVTWERVPPATVPAVAEEGSRAEAGLAA
jgi:glycosyltransferase involved in cell wall biosynthesis